VGPFCWRQQNDLKTGGLYFCSLHRFFSIFFNRFFLLAFLTSSSVILPPASPPPAPLTVIQGHRTTPSAHQPSRRRGVVRRAEILRDFIKHPTRYYGISEIAGKYKVSLPTARTDLLLLEEKRKLKKYQDGKRQVFIYKGDKGKWR
jgi:ribosomal protein S25